MRKLRALLPLLLITAFASAQTNSGPANFASVNSTLYVGASTGWYPTIQATVTAACAVGHKRSVRIPAGYLGSDTITGLTGCSNANLFDDRATPVACYVWSGSAYASAGCAAGSSVTATAMQTALAGQTGCTTAGNSWIPATNTCVPGGASGGGGIYSSITTYSPGNVVIYNGANYLSIQTSTNQPPSSSPAYWSALQTPGTASTPVITPTANVNVLQYTDTMGAYWSLGQLGLATDGQSDENSGTTATKIAGNTVNTSHNIHWNPKILAGGSAQNVNISVYAKPNGYNFAIVGFHTAAGATSSYFDNFVNISTCTVTSSASGVTVTATAAGNGYCRISEQYSLPAFTTLDILYIGGAPASGTTGYVGDNVTGIYTASPQISLTSSVQTYQSVTGTHRYCLAAYVGGVSSGCSMWVTSSAEVNSVATSAVSGAAYCKLFRSSGATTGAVIVSGSSQIACGSTVTDNLLTADGTMAPFAPAVIDPRPTQTQSTEYEVIGPGFDGRILTIEPGLQGTITSIHLSIQPAAADTVRINFRCNGAAVPGQQVDLGTFLMAQDFTGAVFSSNNISVAVGSSGNYSANRKLEIPFTSGCIVDFVNGSGSTIYLFAELQFKPGTYLPNPHRAVWHALLTPTTAAAAYATVSLLPTVTSSGGGEMESTTLFVTPVSVANQLYLEGNPKIFTDGTLSVTANGTEDYFGSGFYFQNINLASDRWGWFHSSNDWLMYRFFGFDQSTILPFSNSMQMTWQNGQQGQSSGTAPSVNYKSLITYWTAQ